MKNRYLIINLFFITLGVIFSIGAMGYGLGVSISGFFPFILGIIFISLSSFALILNIKKRKDEMIERFFPEKDSLRKLLLSLFALFFYAIALDYLGFLLTTFLFLIIELKFIESQKWKTIITAALLTTASSYILFDLLLKGQLPKGVLGI